MTALGIHPTGCRHCGGPLALTAMDHDGEDYRRTCRCCGRPDEDDPALPGLLGPAFLALSPAGFDPSGPADPARIDEPDETCS